MRLAATFVLVVCLPAASFAHFPFLRVERDGGHAALHAYFGHGPEPTDEKYYSRLQEAKVWRLEDNGKPEPLSLRPGKDSLVADLPSTKAAVFGFEKNYGVTTRHGNYLSTNYSKTYSGADAWPIETAKLLRLDIAADRQDDKLVFTVRWNGKPFAGTDVIVNRGDAEYEGQTDAKGRFAVPLSGSGTYTARATRTDETPGEHEGKKYDGLRYTSTLLIEID